MALNGIPSDISRVETLKGIPSRYVGGESDDKAPNPAEVPERVKSGVEDCRETLKGDVFPTSYKNLKLDTSRHHRGLCMSCSTSHLVHPWEGGGVAGSFGAISLLDVEDLAGKWASVVYAHESPLSDLKCSPFYSTICASASQGGEVSIWELPKHGGLLQRVLRDPLTSFSVVPGASMPSNPTPNAAGRRRSALFAFAQPGKFRDNFRVRCSFNPAVDWILAVASGRTGNDGSVFFWNLEAEKEYRVAGVTGHTTEVFWGSDGSLVFSMSDMNVIQAYDPRAPRTVYRNDLDAGQTAIIQSDVISLDGRAGNSRTLLSTALPDEGEFVEARLWDIRRFSETPFFTFKILPCNDAPRVALHWDESLGIIYFLPLGLRTVAIWAKSATDAELKKMSDFKIQEPLRNFCFLHKVAADAERNEVGRLFVTANKTTIRPYTIFSPTWPDIDTLFPPVMPLEPSIGAKSWINGATPVIKRISLAVIEDTFHITQASHKPLSLRASKPKGVLVVSRASAEARIEKLEKQVLKLNEEKESLTTQLPTQAPTQVQTPDAYYSPKAADKEKQAELLAFRAEAAEREKKVATLEREVDRVWKVANEGAGWHQQKIKELTFFVEKKDESIQKLKKELENALAVSEAQERKLAEQRDEDRNDSSNACLDISELLEEKTRIIEDLKEQLKKLDSKRTTEDRELKTVERDSEGVAQSPSLFCCNLSKAK